MIVILKPGKPPDDPNSYRPISLLPIISKIFEKIILRRMRAVIDEKNLIPEIQFGFREKHSLVEQVHRIVHSISQALEKKEFAPAVFLDVSSAFDKVWHSGLINKLYALFTPAMCKLLMSYLSDRTFFVQIAAGVPQGSVLGPTLFLIYTSDFPSLRGATAALYADDCGIVTSDKNYESAVNNLQSAVNEVAVWAKKWKIRLNENKSVRIDFSLRPHNYIPTIINGEPIPVANQARYLGLHLNSKLNWSEHVKHKRELLNLRYRNFYWLIGHRSSLSLANKKLIYTSIFQPMWTYGCEIWGTTRNSNKQIIERFQNKYMRTITKAPWYVTNEQLRADLRLDPVSTVISKKAKQYVKRLQSHPNTKAIMLLDNTHDTRRLQRIHPLDLINC